MNGKILKLSSHQQPFISDSELNISGEKIIDLLSVNQLSWSGKRLAISYFSETGWFGMLLDSVELKAEKVKNVFRSVKIVKAHNTVFNVCGILEVEVREVGGKRLLSVCYAINEDAPSEGVLLTKDHLYSRCVIHDF